MVPNKLKRLWAEEKPTINGWCSTGNPFTAEIMAAQEYDSVTVDVQHGTLDCSSALARVAGASVTRFRTLVGAARVKAEKGAC